jgi:tetratricopeptide (TPR) repeat protein
LGKNEAMIKTFNLLSLGHRGVGKTVFLAANCAEILRFGTNRKTDQSLWFECQDAELQENIEKLVDYTIRTGKYPPPTFKIDDFNFTFKRKTIAGEQALCDFNWFDIPGEWCNIHNPDFQATLLSSHGCCVFIDSYALLHQQSYLQTIEQLMTQLEAIVSMVNQYGQNRFKYPFALICTKCDLIEQVPIRFLQLEEKLRLITKRLDLAKAHYRRFYVAVPILNDGEGGIVPVKGTTVPLLWLMSELTKIHGTLAQFNLGDSIDHMLSISMEPAGAIEPRRPMNFTEKLTKSQKVIAVAVGVCGTLGLIAAILLNSGLFRPQSTGQSVPEQHLQGYERVLQRDPTNREAISQAIDAYLQQGQPDKAIAQLKKSLQSWPQSITRLDKIRKKKKPMIRF